MSGKFQAPPAIVAHLGNYFGQKGGLSISKKTIWKFYDYFLYQMQIERGLFLAENCQIIRLKFQFSDQSIPCQMAEIA